MRASAMLPSMVVLATLAPAPSASAANQFKPRVPVVWTADTCATVVDQSTAPVVHFDYSIASEEDPEDRTPDEVGDSRTHQFFALGRQDFVGTLPLWISRSDIERASLVDSEVVAASIDAEQVLDESSRFAAADWRRITADDARVPITFAQAAMGVDWDTTDVAPGTYEIWGYTWEPAKNEWARRAGFVKVVPSAADAAAAGPSISLLFDQVQIAAGSPYVMPGCADVGPGTTVTLQWGERIGTLEPEWESVIEDEPIDSGTLTLAFVPPDEAGDKTIALRAIVTDAAGNSYTAYAPASIAVTPNPNPGEDDDGGAQGCAVDRGGSAWLLLLPIVGGRLRRRRRRRRRRR